MQFSHHQTLTKRLWWLRKASWYGSDVIRVNLCSNAIRQFNELNFVQLLLVEMGPKDRSITDSTIENWALRQSLHQTYCQRQTILNY
jgi:hypothetical protein